MKQTRYWTRKGGRRSGGRCWKLNLISKHYIFTGESSRRQVVTDKKKVLLITDRQLMDHSEFDVYFQPMYEPGFTFRDWRDLIKEGRVPHRQKIVVLAIGNNMMPTPVGFSPKNQMRKLLGDILAHMPWVEKVMVTSVFPRGDREVYYQDMVKDMNVGYSSAVHLLRSSSPVTRRMLSFLPTHKLFLEEHEYFDFNTGAINQQIRIVKPVNIYFEPDQPSWIPKGWHIIALTCS